MRSFIPVIGETAQISSINSNTENDLQACVCLFSPFPTGSFKNKMKVSFTVNYKIAISVQFCEVQKNGVGKNISIIHKKKIWY